MAALTQVSNIIIVSLALCVLPASWAIAADHEDDAQYKSSVFGLLFGNLLDGGEGGSHGSIGVSKDIPYDYVEHFGQDGGETYSKANVLVIDRYTSKKTELILVQDKSRSLDAIGIKLLKCWQKPADGVSKDARALLFLTRDSSITGKNAEGTKAWFFSKYPALSYSDTRYELMLQGCMGSSSTGTDDTQEAP